MRRFAALGFIVPALAGCGQSGSADESPAAARIERCVDRFLARAEPAPGVSEDELRRYVRSAYCERFESRGWVHDDGALRIGAQEWLESAGAEECEAATAATPDQPSTTVPCDELRPRETSRSIDCALLHHVRRSEVRDYLEKLRSQSEIECDDGTPFEELGAP